MTTLYTGALSAKQQQAEELASLTAGHPVEVIPTQPPKPRKRTDWVDPDSKLVRKVQVKKEGVWMTPARRAVYDRRKEKNRLEREK